MDKNLKTFLLAILLSTGASIPGAQAVKGSDVFPDYNQTRSELNSNVLLAARKKKKSKSKGKVLDTEAFQQNYWNLGEKEQISIIQNRKFSKAYRLEIGAFWGVTNSDPFLTVRQIGGTLRYYLGEYFSVGGVFMQHSTSDSTAAKDFKSRFGEVLNTNPQKQLYGGEISWAPLYGKLSLLGSLIIYQDIYTLAGAGLIKTKTGEYFTPWLGIGQMIYINDLLSLNFNFRLTYYDEVLVDDTQRRRFDGQVNFGLNFLLF